MSRTHTTSVHPAPSLSPATIDALTKSSSIIDLVHSDTLDPEFLFLSALTPTALQTKASGFEAAYLKSRVEALRTAIHGTEGGALSSRAKAVLVAKQTVYEGYLKVYEAKGEGPEGEAFLKLSRKAWEEDVKDALAKVEGIIKVSHVAGGEEPSSSGGSPTQSSTPINKVEPNRGSTGATHTSETSRGANAPEPSAKPGAFILGEHLCLADMHLFPWLAKVVALCGGGLNKDGLKAVEKVIGGG